jgi:hypothetical protein
MNVIHTLTITFLSCKLVSISLFSHRGVLLFNKPLSILLMVIEFTFMGWVLILFCKEEKGKRAQEKASPNTSYWTAYRQHILFYSKKV